MKGWLVSIASISVISAVADMLLPNAQVSRYAKLCISLLLTTVIIRPVTGFKPNDFTFDIPVFENNITTENNNIVDMEFSKRLTDALKTDTGFENIFVSAQLGYDRVNSLRIEGAQHWQVERINTILLEKYNIPTEIITYGPD